MTCTHLIFLHPCRKIPGISHLRKGDPARFLQNLECKGVNSKFFEISRLGPIVRRKRQTPAVLLRVRPVPTYIASMNPVCAFCIQGQDYASQDAKILAVENPGGLSENGIFGPVRYVMEFVADVDVQA